MTAYFVCTYTLNKEAHLRIFSVSRFQQECLRPIHSFQMTVLKKRVMVLLMFESFLYFAIRVFQSLHASRE